MKELIEQHGEMITALAGIMATILLLGACWSVYQSELTGLLESILIG